MSVYTKSTLGYVDNLVTCNDISTDPYYRVNARAPQRFQLREQDVPVPFELGISDFNTLIGQVMYVIDGTMYPRSQDTYDSGLNALRDVSNLDLSQSDSNGGVTFDNNGYVPYVWGDSVGVLSKQLFVKPLYVQASESTRQGFVVPFRIFCKVKDPTIYGASLKIASTALGDPTATVGTAAYPLSYPVAFGATYYTVSANAINSGTVPVYPQSIDIYGPVTNPKFTNTATGEFIQINCTLSSPTDHLQIQYGKDYLGVYLNGNSQLQNKTTDSTFFKIHPGSNNISLTGSSIASGSYATVNYYDGYSLA